MERAIDEMHDYLERKVSEIGDVEDLIRDTISLNHRQVALVSDAATHGVVHETARSDLRDLADRELLIAHRQGRRWRYTVPTDLADRIRR